MATPEVQSSQLEIVKGGDSLIRLENDTQMMVAVQRPRDEKTILRDALAELDLYPTMAEMALYTKPVGRDAESGSQKEVEGLSIRTAESLANRWRNSSYAVDIVAQDSDSVTIAAVFLDYEQNTRHVVQKRVSRYYTTREKQIKAYTPDRFDTIISANMSKVLREVILRSLPSGLKAEYEKKVRTIMHRGNLPRRRKEMVTRFSALKVTVAQLEAYKQKKIEEFTNDDLVTMVGLYNAIRDGEVNVKDAFKAPPALEKAVDPPLRHTTGTPEQQPLTK